MEEDNMIVYLNTVIDGLQEMKKNIELELSKIYVKEWFEKFKDNKFCDYGKVCISIDMAKKHRQEYMDLAKDEIQKVERGLKNEI